MKKFIVLLLVLVVAVVLVSCAREADLFKYINGNGWTVLYACSSSDATNYLYDSYIITDGTTIGFAYCNAILKNNIKDRFCIVWFKEFEKKKTD